MKNGTTLAPLHGKVTQRFISRKLDVSVSTVSRALSDNPNVNKETKRKILEIANELNYSPNEVALSLKYRKTKRIGVVFDEDFSQEMLMAVIQGILKNDHWPVLGSLKNAQELVRNGLDGMVVLGTLDMERPLTVPSVQIVQDRPLIVLELLSDLFRRLSLTRDLEA